MLTNLQIFLTEPPMKAVRLNDIVLFYIILLTAEEPNKKKPCVCVHTRPVETNLVLNTNDQSDVSTDIVRYILVK